MDAVDFVEAHIFKRLDHAHANADGFDNHFRVKAVLAAVEKNFLGNRSGKVGRSDAAEADNLLEHHLAAAGKITERSLVWPTSTPRMSGQRSNMGISRSSALSTKPAGIYWSPEKRGGRPMTRTR
jgi:hypothetical protein